MKIPRVNIEEFNNALVIASDRSKALNLMLLILYGSVAPCYRGIFIFVSGLIHCFYVCIVSQVGYFCK